VTGTNNWVYVKLNTSTIYNKGADQTALGV
jgi:hypothetical protein